MVEHYWEQQPALSLTRRKLKARGKGLSSLTEEDMTLILEIIQLITPLKTATKCLSEEKTPTIHIIAPTLAKLRGNFEPDDKDLLNVSAVYTLVQLM